MNQKTSRKPDLSGMAEKWPSVYVAREKVGVFTGGAVAPKSCANADYEGTGPKKRIRLAGKVVYPIDSLIEWLESRAMVLD